MSLNAYIWASSLPLDLTGPTAFRVLLKYADRVDERGRTAWWKAIDLAYELGCSERTAQRAVRELIDKGLLIEGDQRFVQHIRGGQRPVVYDINMSPNPAPRLALGDTTPSDVADGSSYDNRRSGATTTVVAHRTVIEPNNSSTNVSTESYDKFVVARFGVQPAPKLPRLSDYAPTPKQPKQPPEQLALNAEAMKLDCPAHGGRFRHLVPASDVSCVRCLDPVSTILEGAHE